MIYINAFLAPKKYTCVMSKEFQPSLSDSDKQAKKHRLQSWGLKAAGLALIPAGITGIAVAAMQDASSNASHTTTISQEIEGREKASEPLNYALAFGGVGSIVGGYMVFLEGVVRGRNRQSAPKIYKHEIHPWMAFGAYTSEKKFSDARKNEISLYPHLNKYKL